QSWLTITRQHLSGNRQTSTFAASRSAGLCWLLPISRTTTWKKRSPLPAALLITAATLQSSRVLSYIADFRTRLAAVYADDPIVRRFNEYTDAQLSLKRAPMSRRLVVT